MPIAFADGALARRVEAGWVWTTTASALGVKAARPELRVACQELGGGAAAFFGPGSPLSQAQGLGLDGPLDVDTLAELDAFFFSRGVAASVEVATLADPWLLPALSARGYRISETTHALVREVRPGGAAAVPGVAVRPVDPDDPGGRAALGRVLLAGFFEGPGEPPAAVADAMDALTRAEGMTAWVARVAGVADGADPAGVASLFVHEGLALFAGDATLPAFRRRGVQSALIAARLAQAERAGCDLATVCVAPGSTSQRNYERKGFRVAYARIHMTREPDPGAGAGGAPR